MNYHLNVLNDLHFNANRQSSALGIHASRTLVRAGNEAYEKCATAYRGDELYKVSSWQDLGPNALKNKAIFPLTLDVEHAIEELPDTERIAWVPAWSLSHEKIRWVPAAHCYFGFPSGIKYVQGHTRGLAAGPSLTFAIYKGLAELIETLGTRRWHLSSDTPPEVDLPSFNDELFNSMASVHQEKGRDLWVFDISNHLNLPFFVFVAVSYDPEQKTVLQGAAASHTPEKAIRSALLECTQMLPNLMLSQQEQITSRSVAQKLEPFQERGSKKRTASFYEGNVQASLSIHDLVQQLSRQDIEVIVKDLTRAEVPISVARVMFHMNE